MILLSDKLFDSSKHNAGNKGSEHHDGGSEFVGTGDSSFLVNELSDFWFLGDCLNSLSFNSLFKSWNVDSSLNRSAFSLVLNGVNDSIDNLRLVSNWLEFSVFSGSMELLDASLISYKLFLQSGVNIGFPARNTTHFLSA